MRKNASGRSKIGPNTTAPAKARKKTAGPNGSFPIGDRKHARLAIQMAPKSYNAGNISKSTEQSIQRKARAELNKSAKSPSKSYEKSARDIAEDKRGAKKLGMTMAQYEKTDRDRREDMAGQRRMNKK